MVQAVIGSFLYVYLSQECFNKNATNRINTITFVTCWRFGANNKNLKPNNKKTSLIRQTTNFITLSYAALTKTEELLFFLENGG